MKGHSRSTYGSLKVCMTPGEAISKRQTCNTPTKLTLQLTRNGHGSETHEMLYNFLKALSMRTQLAEPRSIIREILSPAKGTILLHRNNSMHPTMVPSKRSITPVKKISGRFTERNRQSGLWERLSKIPPSYASISLERIRLAKDRDSPGRIQKRSVTPRPGMSIEAKIRNRPATPIKLQCSSSSNSRMVVGQECSKYYVRPIQKWLGMYKPEMGKSQSPTLNRRWVKKRITRTKPVQTAEQANQAISEEIDAPLLIHNFTKQGSNDSGKRPTTSRVVLQIPRTPQIY